jgi:hypothetical protein
MEFKYEEPSRPEIVEAFNKTRTARAFIALIDSLFENGGIKGEEEHVAAFEGLKRFLPSLSTDECGSVAAISQIKSELCEFAYEACFKKARSWVVSS